MPGTESSLGANDPALREPRYQLGFYGRHAGHADFLRELDFMPGILGMPIFVLCLLRKPGSMQTLQTFGKPPKPVQTFPNVWKAAPGDVGCLLIYQHFQENPVGK